MMTERKSNSSQSTNLVVLLAAFALLAGLYYSLRFGGWSMEGDASSYTTAAIGMVNSGKIDYPGAYNNGYGYSTVLTLISQVTGLQVQDIQLGSALWVFVLALVAFITYREFLESASVAALGVLLLFLQPDFLFYVVRGGHEKYIWTYALLMLFLLARSYREIEKPARLVIYIVLFYLTFWAFIANNVYFAAAFMSAIILSLVGGWVLIRLGVRKQVEDQIKSRMLQRLIIVSMTCFILVFVFINYTYRPALQIYSIFTSLYDKISLLLFGTQQAQAPLSYLAFSIAWRSQPIYLLLTGSQWLIVIVSLIAWVIGLFNLSKMDHKRWMMWLMYSAFGFLAAFGIVADFSNFLNSNLQLRIFTPIALFSSIIAADLIAKGFQKFVARKRYLTMITTCMVVLIIIFGAAMVALKVTNDPVFGNQWLFYIPEELAPANWINNNGIQQQQVWVDTSEHLPRVYYFWEGFRPIIDYQYLNGVVKLPPPYTQISELTRLRANRSGVSLPEVDDQNRVYDDGQVQIYHRRPMTLYQR